MEFIESPIFSKVIYEYLNEEEYIGLQWYLALHPEAGKIIQGSGGLRKIRWQAKGQGKKGGIRTIYYYKAQEGKIWLLTAFAKNEMENIPSHILRKIKENVIDA
jgi:hypothetical protein